MLQTQYVINSLKDTKSFAGRLTPLLRPPMVIGLIGDLGSGKTTFVQYMAEALGIDDHVSSPSYTLINEYSLKSGWRLIHADLYRLQDASEIELLGLADYFHEANTVTVIEWADRMPKLLPPSTLWLTFELVNNRRVMTITNPDAELWYQLTRGDDV